MIEIMQNLNQYVPFRMREDVISIDSTSGVVPVNVFESHQILFGGDQLTVAHARSAKRNVSNGDNGLSRLDGLIPVVEDWHSQLNLLTVRLLHACKYLLLLKLIFITSFIDYMEIFLQRKICW